MLRDYNSTRSVKWLKRNLLSNPSCEEYVKNLLSLFELPNYKIECFDTSEKSLWITYGSYSYVISVSLEEIGLATYQKKKTSQTEKYTKVLGKRFFGDKCWYDCLSWIKNREL